MNKEQIREVLANHAKWSINSKGGVRANLRSTNLRDADLRDANLRGADLSDANLRGADLSDANLSDADLRGANLRGADLRGADLIGADLRGADLIDANLSGANLSGANLSNTIANLQCPEEGSFIVWKKCYTKRYEEVIVKLLISENALRSSATSRKCRASKAIVLDILDTNDTYAISKRDPNFIYKKGETVEVKNFDTDRWSECSTGIHFFITKKEAEEY